MPVVARAKQPPQVHTGAHLTRPRDLMLRFKYATLIKTSANSSVASTQSHVLLAITRSEMKQHLTVVIYLVSEFFQFLIFLCDQGTSNIDGFL